MLNFAQKNIKYLTYAIGALIALVLVVFGFQDRNAKSELLSGDNVSDFLVDTVHADHDSGSYYDPLFGYGGSYYGDGDGDGDGDGG